MSPIRVWAVPGVDNSRSSELIPPGLPVFWKSGSPNHFRLLKGWLSLCDGGRCGYQGECRRNSNTLPTRLLDLGEGGIHTDTVYLRGTAEISTNPAETRYIALSHCWGEKMKGMTPEWCTTYDNESTRKKEGFSIDEVLPKTFKDTIKVARAIGVRYLWIDSLCIMQGDGGDWNTEATKMTEVFKNAYCTIAAASAEDSDQGFLDQRESDFPYAMVPNSSHGKVFVCRATDDFPGDVENGVLNTRAWVLQERLLSARTIHFTKRQTYWECGGGVRCETLTNMRNGNHSFRYDPNFPGSIGDRSLTAQIKLVQDLFEQYTTLSLTYQNDRPTAIHSLAMELGKALDTNVAYGIFGKAPFLHRSLLWRGLGCSLKQILPELPSWSWMAYHVNDEQSKDAAKIKYQDVEDVEWDKSVRLVEQQEAGNNRWILKARVMRRRDTSEEDGDKEDLYFDLGQALDDVRYAVMGRKADANPTYYVLVVQGSPASGWKRVGMGLVPKRYILFDDQDIVAKIW
ncbi:heterokaryon incompatibility protein-domain-containing protein [Rhypophila decipiens]|uniref:Heterokaryon incompatibility protein-domain-containing protein n=1 Tax=Rhypophila decipiens TaxID=261697 RepID=A0AAN7AYL5_9PEZI|nr:heterokaryon incompatibility protein-domain-containing protein [Rhypophila decipiens]